MKTGSTRGLRPGARIAVFRALQLGDMLCSVPALRALRRGEPTAHITLIGLPWAAEFARRFARYVDDFMPFPGAPGLPEQAADPSRLRAFYAAARKRGFDFAIQLHGSGSFSNAITNALGARASAGFVAVNGNRTRDYPDTCYLTWPKQISEVDRCLRLMSHLGYAGRSDQLEFPLNAVDHAAWQAIAKKHGLRQGGYVCVHPGARMPSRRWPIDRFAEVARQLAAQDWPIVLTGTAAEAGLAAAFSARLQAPSVDLCARTSLGALAAVIANSRLLLCNDTGVSHLAAAVRTPSLVVSCGSDVTRWSPNDRELHVTLADHPPCRPCMHHACPIGHPCALAVDSARVARAATCLLEKEKEAIHVA